MIISLTHDEIEQALVEFVSNQGIMSEGTEATVQIKAGRKGNGHTAIVTINPVAEANEEEEYEEAEEPAAKKNVFAV